MWIQGRFKTEKLKMPLLENKLEGRTVIRDDKKCWPEKGRRGQIGLKGGLGKLAKGAEK